MGNKHCRLLFGKRRFFCSDFFKYHTAKQTKLQNAELNARIVLNLFLQCIGKLRKTLICHNVQQVYVSVLNTLSVLIDAKTQAAPHLLPCGQRAFLLNERTNLKDVWIVPTLF